MNKQSPENKQRTTDFNPTIVINYIKCYRLNTPQIKGRISQYGGKKAKSNCKVSIKRDEMQLVRQ